MIKSGKHVPLACTTNVTNFKRFVFRLFRSVCLSVGLSLVYFIYFVFRSPASHTNTMTNHAVPMLVKWK